MRRYLSRLKSEVRAGMAERRSTTGPRMAPFTWLAVPLVLIYIVLAIFIVRPDDPRNFNFASERGAVTVLSGIFLSMASAFAFIAFLLSVGSPRVVRWFWFMVTMSLGFLAMDELLGFHEAIGSVLDGRDFLGVKSSTAIRAWNDLVVVLYGVVALPVVVAFLPVIVRVPSFPELSGVAFVFYVVHTAIDTLTEPPTFASVVLEESAKLFAGLFLGLASLAGALWCATGSTSKPQSQP